MCLPRHVRSPPSKGRSVPALEHQHQQQVEGVVVVEEEEGGGGEGGEESY